MSCFCLHRKGFPCFLLSFRTNGDILMLKKTCFADCSVNAHSKNTVSGTCRVMAILCVFILLFGLRCTAQEASAASMMKNPFFALMTRAAAHAKLHGDRFVPALSPAKETLLSPTAFINVKAMQAAGFAVVPWTVDDTEAMRALLDLHVDGIISDRPDLLAAVLKEARKKAAGDAVQLAYLDRFDAQGHRGGRGLRPENTLPAFEAGLDNGINSIETDTGVTTDHQSLIWHDQFLNPQSCRRADGKPYTLENRVYTHDISMADAQRTFICDKLHFGPDQKNDLALSPVSVAFAAEEHMISPYAPTNAAQLFRFVDFYAHWYRSGAGKSDPDAVVRARTAAHVHFNLETKILPPGYSAAKMEAVGLSKTEAELRLSGKTSPSDSAPNNTVSPEVFVETLCGFIQAYHMEDRADVQSFDFRTLLLVQERYPKIQTYYLTASPNLLNSDFTPESLRVSR
jgi:glycerophosphoryl diester phosphodiesterase